MRRTNLLIGLLLIGLGLLTFTGVLGRLASIDVTPPNINVALLGGTQPLDGQTYQPNILTYVALWTHDRESNINSTSAIYILDGGSPVKLDLQPSQPKAYPMAMAFEKSGLADPSPGTHSFKFIVKNGVGLTGELSGTFTVYGEPSSDDKVSNGDGPQNGEDYPNGEDISEGFGFMQVLGLGSMALGVVFLVLPSKRKR